jgi:hypothetical protein
MNVNCVLYTAYPLTPGYAAAAFRRFEEQIRVLQEDLDSEMQVMHSFVTVPS